VPFRVGPDYPDRAKVQFTTAAWMPYRIYRACLATGIVSNTVYCQHALCEALARDLGLDLHTMLDDLPAPRGPSGHLYDPGEHTMARVSITEHRTGGVLRIGPANTVEEVR
jgi:hypothetical protein